MGKVTKSEKERIAELYEDENKSGLELSEMFNVSPSSIYNYLDEMGIERQNGENQYTRIEEGEWAEKRKEEFVSIIDDLKSNNESSDCWNWPSYRNDSGYGRFSVHNKQILAHRLVIRWVEGKNIPEDKVVCHDCDNPSCVNPNHLWVGTQKENCLDSVDKGRWITNSRKGSDVNTSKLTEKEVREIREIYENTSLTQKDLGERYGVRGSTIGRIVRNEYWNHID